MGAFPHIRYAAKSDIGRKRTNNEDSFGAFPESGIFCVADGMGGGDDGCARKTGILLPVAACLSNGLFNFFIKVNESQGGSAFLFFAISYGTAALLSLTLGFALTVKEQEARFPLGKGYLRRALAPMLLIGVCNGVCFYTARLLAERMNAAAQFTVVTCMSILLSLFVGFVFQGDKFNKKSALSIFFCIVALVCQYSGIA